MKIGKGGGRREKAERIQRSRASIVLEIYFCECVCRVSKYVCEHAMYATKYFHVYLRVCIRVERKRKRVKKKNNNNNNNNNKE